MSTIIKALLLNLFITFLAFPQFFSQPESAVYDPVGNRYFISNYGSGSIIEIDSNGNRSFFQKGYSKFLGMVLCNDTLFIVENPSKILAFNISTSEQILEIKIKGAEFLNDITIDNNNLLYCTDSRAGIIFKVDPLLKQYSIFKKNILSDPNGILFDKFNNRLLVCYFRDSSRIDAIDFSDSSVKILTNRYLSNLDGLTMDTEGNIYVSSWEKGSFSKGFSRNGKIYKFSNDFTTSQIFLPEMYGPADIFIDTQNNVLVVPLFLINNVHFEKLN